MSGRPLVISRQLWREVTRELRARGHGRRESGAFLLAARNGQPTRIVAAAYYDDLDPDSLTGAISFNTIGYSALADRCSSDGLTVVADVHTHPGRSTRQSTTDRAHPMVAIAGHIALIVPHYADRSTALRQVGVHAFHGADGWTSTTGRAGRDHIRHETLLERLRPARSR